MTSPKAGMYNKVSSANTGAGIKKILTPPPPLNHTCLHGSRQITKRGRCYRAFFSSVPSVSGPLKLPPELL